MFFILKITCNKFLTGSIPDGIAVDPTSQLVFYTDTGYDVIVAMRADGSASKVVVSQGLDQPRAICLDTLNGYVRKIENGNWKYVKETIT